VTTTLLMSDYDLPTRSASGFLLRYIVPRCEPFQFYSIFARRLPFEFSAPKSDIIIGTGHGSKTTFTGQNESSILEAGRYNPKDVKGKVIKLISCQTGVSLGPDLVNNGAEAFLGYVDDYVWVCDSDHAATPWADKLAGVCLLPVIDGIDALLDGKTAQESLDIELDGYLKNAAAEEDELLKSCLEFNHKNAVLFGNPAATVRARPNISIPVAPPPNIFPIF
jgi:hypothetical protein